MRAETPRWANTPPAAPTQETIWLGDTPIAVIKPTADPANPKV
ncbi:hypothetical protein [Andreprevotia sp. IGB-42]|nr:hypothetical protein [Andreprevotia sp. IGB-42]